MAPLPPQYLRVTQRLEKYKNLLGVLLRAQIEGLVTLVYTSGCPHGGSAAGVVGMDGTDAGVGEFEEVFVGRDEGFGSGVDGGGPDISPPAPNVDWIDNTFPPVDSSDDVPTDRPMERADIRGRISTISAPTDGASADRAGGSILVEGPAKTGGIDKAWTTITSETILVRMTESGYVKVSHSALIVGNEVMVQFEGPVMESYPVQATAGIIVIIG